MVDKVVLQTAACITVGTFICYLVFWKLRSKKREYTKVGRVSNLLIYPVKGMAGQEVESADCASFGMKVNNLLDRTWMVVSDNGQFIDQKSEPRLVLLKPHVKGDQLWIERPDGEPLVLDIFNEVPPTKNVMTCKLYGKKIQGIDCGEDAANWLKEFTGKSNLRLTQYINKFALRPANLAGLVNLDAKKYPVAYQAGNTFHLITAPSLEDLNGRLEKKISHINFRPNIIVDGCLPFEEDRWRYVKIGEHATFIRIKPCERCTITTVNPLTGVKEESREPICTLRKYRLATDPKQRKAFGESPLFGMNYGLENEGKISIGDQVFAVLD